MTTQPINEDIAHFLLRHMSIASKREIIILENNKIVDATDLWRLGLSAEESSIDGLMRAATPETRQIMADTTKIWQKFLSQFPQTDLTRCHLNINLQFTFKSGKKSLFFTFSHMGEARQIVFVREGSHDLDNHARILDPQAKVVYHYDGSCWQVEDWNLSDKEYNVLHLTAQGLSVKEIADTMSISADTVNFYKKRIYKKMGATNAMGSLASFARKTGIPLEDSPIMMNEAYLV